MSKQDAELAITLVEDLLGDVCAQVFGKIIRHGRSSLLTVQSHTRLSSRQLKHALAVLVQKRLVSWDTDVATGVSVYEADIGAAILLIRAGKTIEVAQTCFGSIAAELVSILLQHGHMQVSKLKIMYQEAIPNTFLPRNKTKAGLEGDNRSAANGQRSSVQDVSRTIGELLAFGLILPINESSFRSAADNELELERIVGPVADYKAKSKVEKEALREREKDQMRLEWKYGTKEERREIGHFKSTMKRPREEHEEFTSRKRARYESEDHELEPSTNGAFEHSSALEAFNSLDDLVVDLDPAKLSVRMRNDALISLCENKIGRSTAKIYAQALRLLESDVRACKEDSDDMLDDEKGLKKTTKITTQPVSAAFKNVSEFEKALGQADAGRSMSKSKDHPKKRRRKYEESDGDSDTQQDESDIEDDDMADISPTPSAVIRSHLLLLAKHPVRFLDHHKPTDNSHEHWTVDYTQLSRVLVRNKIIETITTRFGTSSARLANICIEKGRVDERTIGTLSLMTAKDVRSRLLALQTAGLLEVQELPRDISRVASRTMFLYFLDDHKCSARIVEDCHKAMLRCLQRMRLEKAKVANVLEKVQRTDVRGREDDLLGPMEKQGLQRWRAVETKLLGEIGRLDDVLAFLCDF